MPEDELLDEELLLEERPELELLEELEELEEELLEDFPELELLEVELVELLEDELPDDVVSTPLQALSRILSMKPAGVKTVRNIVSP